MSNLTLGSLFDGSGGFCLGAIYSDIKPIWASEVAPYPIRVTTKRMPEVKHYGDISKMSGKDIEPVDIITFGSPCQDMSIAGRREGLEGNRSSLFFEAIRIIQEMREVTGNAKPRYIVWENVTGSFSSNKGEDFRKVLSEICKLKDSSLDVPTPTRWLQAGQIMGDDFSLAWRVLDAQYWGVPQRRKRVYLVADFNGRSAGKVLFESEGLPWDIRACQAKGKDIATATRDGTNSSSTALYENHGQDARYTGPLEVAPTVLSTYGSGGNNQSFVVEKNKTFDVRLTNENAKVQRARVVETNVSRTIDTGGNTPDSNQGGIAVVYAIDREAVCAGKNFARNLGVSETVNSTLKATGPSYAMTYSTSKNSHHTNASIDIANTLVASDYKDPPAVTSGRYTVRRITPKECARLQGFPDDWCDGLETEDVSSSELSFWREVFDTDSRLSGKAKKTDSAIIKWLKEPNSDSAQYKMWGNGVALPNVIYVLSGILYYSQK